MAPLHCLRFVDVSEWNPASLNWQRLMLQLSSNEQKQVTRFVFSKDQKLALASRLLQRQLIHELFHTNYENIEIKRTPEVRSLNNVAYHYWYLHLCKTANNLCRYLLSLEQTILEARDQPEVSLLHCESTTTSLIVGPSWQLSVILVL